MPIKRILIANRGEIAVRIINACRELEITSVAVYSDADRHAYHTMHADEAFYIGGAPAAESYLNSKKLISTARKARCDAVHPGYGFLAENEGFAAAVQEAGLRFIGPPPDAIGAMGDKTVARKMMAEAGVPVVPGTGEPVRNAAAAERAAAEIGYPVLIKAAGGGGGKGMRTIEKPSGIAEGFRRAVSEASSSFGNPLVYLEKYLESPRHIEFQILADTRGNIIHLGERECSIQRRYQKVIEEAPSSVLTEEERARFGEIAVRAARACGYVNAGTVEFLMDKHRNFYFLEMNTRLQVEHPVTEQITRIDLVNEQIRIACGEELTFHQEDIRFSGHAVECRIYAEDAAHEFYPSTGTIVHLREPTGAGIRVDSGIRVLSDVPLNYDPLIAKLICTGETRRGAVARSLQALNDYEIRGVATTIPFCHFVLSHRQFRNGTFDTNFVRDSFTPDLLQTFSSEEKLRAAAAAAFYTHRTGSGSAPKPTRTLPVRSNSWKSRGLRDALR